MIPKHYEDFTCSSTFYKPYNLQDYQPGCGLRKRPSTTKGFTRSNSRNNFQPCGSAINFHHSCCCCSIRPTFRCQCQCGLLPSLFHKLLTSPYTKLHNKKPKKQQAKETQTQKQNNVTYLRPMSQPRVHFNYQPGLVSMPAPTFNRIQVVPSHLQTPSVIQRPIVVHSQPQPQHQPIYNQPVNINSIPFNTRSNINYLPGQAVQYIRNQPQPAVTSKVFIQHQPHPVDTIIRPESRRQTSETTPIKIVYNADEKPDNVSSSISFKKQKQPQTNILIQIKQPNAGNINNSLTTKQPQKTQIMPYVKQQQKSRNSQLMLNRQASNMNMNMNMNMTNMGMGSNMIMQQNRNSNSTSHNMSRQVSQQNCQFAISKQFKSSTSSSSMQLFKQEHQQQSKQEHNTDYRAINNIDNNTHNAFIQDQEIDDDNDV